MSEPNDSLARLQAFADQLPETPLRLKVAGSPVVLEKKWIQEVCAELDARRTDQTGDSAELDALRGVYAQVEALYQQAAQLAGDAQVVTAAELCSELHFILTGESSAPEHPEPVIEAMLATLRSFSPAATREDAIKALDTMRTAVGGDEEIEVEEEPDEVTASLADTLAAIERTPIPVPRVSGAEILGRKTDAHNRVDLGSIGQL